MAISKPVKVPQKELTSTDVVSFNGGVDQRGDANAEPNTFTSGRNIMVNVRGLLTHRFGLRRWLPSTVGTVHQIYPVLYNSELYYFVADDGKVKYIQDGDADWTECGGDNEVTTTEGIITTFLRIVDKVLVLNGVDRLRYIDLTDMEMVKYTEVEDPEGEPSATLTGLSGTGDAKVYYAINWNSTVGQTGISPIHSVTVNKQRDSWKTDGTEYITVDRNNTAPTGALSWNLWMATAAAGGSATASDMLLLAAGLDVNMATFVDNGSLPIDISRGTAPEDNSTEGPKAKYGRETSGRPILYGDPDNPYTLWIGGDGANALDFSPTNGGYQAVLNKGTNFYPMDVIGFRNGQGVPSLTVLFSNTEGISKQSVLEQQTITYGNISFVVWTTTEQNYGASGISSPYGVVNYLGGLHFPSPDGFMTMETKPSVVNVMATSRISDRIYETVKSIKNSALERIVGTAWSNRVHWLIPSRGYSYNNQIAIYDLTNQQAPMWYLFDVRAQWIGTVTPREDNAFVYVCQDNHIFRLDESYVAQDEDGSGVRQPFPVEARGSLLGITDAHNTYKAVVQAVFYLDKVIGTVRVGVTYRNASGRLKTRSKVITRGSYTTVSSDGGWSSPGYLYTGPTTYLQWDDIPTLDSNETAKKDTVRVRLPLNVIGSEFQWFLSTDLTNSSFILRSVSYEGENLGVKADFR